MTGTFVVFEGPEGGGKTVQLSRLGAELRAAGHPVLTTREPGGTVAGDWIRAILLDQADIDLNARTEVLLLAAARVQHVEEVIRPALDRGLVVLCDRYIDSTFAYQGGGDGVDRDVLEHVTSFATGGLLPSVRILFDVPPEIGLARRHADMASVNRIDRKELAFHQRVRAEYLARAAASPDDWLVVDATLPIETVASIVRNHLTRKIEQCNTNAQV